MFRRTYIKIKILFNKMSTYVPTGKTYFECKNNLINFCTKRKYLSVQG